MYKITLVIPIYNSGKYLEYLLESVIRQTLDFKDVQVVMVDDCSTDNSRVIMDKYEKKYDNFFSIKLNRNHKVAGTARNAGIEIAKGKYLMFSDADDFFIKDSFEKMYNEIEEKNADFVTANYINTDEDGTLWDKPIFDKQKYTNFKLSITDYDKSFFILNSSACNKIFRTDFVYKHNIRFLEGVPAEDAYFTTSCFMKSSTVYYINDVMYCYRQRNKNSSTKSVSFNCSKEYFDNINSAYMQIYENFKRNNYIGFYRYTYAKNMSYMLYKFIDSKLLSFEDRIDILKNMRWFYKLSKILKVPPCQVEQEMIIDKIIVEDYFEAINYCKIISNIRDKLPKEIKENLSRPDAAMYKTISENDNEFKNRGDKICLM